MSDTEDAASDAGALVEPVSPAGGGGGGEKPKLSSYSADDIRAEITRRGMPLNENNSGTKDEAKTVEERRQGERKPVIIGKTEGVHASDGNKTETAFKVEWKDSTSKQGTWKDLAHLKKHIKSKLRLYNINLKLRICRWVAYPVRQGAPRDCGGDLRNRCYERGVTLFGASDGLKHIRSSDEADEPMEKPGEGSAETAQQDRY
jgi:hypothetical protein